MAPAPRDRLVALPGTLGPPAMFDRLAAAASDVEIRALSWLTTPGPWDIPSLATWVTAQLDEPVILCGHSTGGAIALAVAATWPEKVTGLLLLDTGAHMQGHRDVGAIIQRVGNDWGDELRAAVLDRSFRTPPDPDDRARWLAWAATVRRDAVRDVLTSQAALDLRPRLSAITVPTVVVHGEYDKARSTDDARELAAAIPGAELVLVPTGHSPMYEAPERVAEALALLRT